MKKMLFLVPTIVLGRIDLVVTDAMMIKHDPKYTKMSQIEKEQAKLEAARSLEKRIHGQVKSLENKIKTVKAELSQSSHSSKMKQVANKIGQPFKYSWNKIKSCCSSLKAKFWKDSKSEPKQA